MTIKHKKLTSLLYLHSIDLKKDILKLKQPLSS